MDALRYFSVYHQAAGTWCLRCVGTNGKQHVETYHDLATLLDLLPVVLERYRDESKPDKSYYGKD